MGSAPASPAIQQVQATPAAPPVSATAGEVVQAGIDLRRQEMLKKSIKGTVFAGDTGGWRPPASISTPGGGGSGTGGAASGGGGGGGGRAPGGGGASF